DLVTTTRGKPGAKLVTSPPKCGRGAIGCPALTGQKMTGHQGWRDQPNAIDKSFNRNGSVVLTRPAAASDASDVPPRYAAPNASISRVTSAVASLRSHDATPSVPACSRHVPAFHGQRSSTTVSTASTGRM